MRIAVIGAGIAGLTAAWLLDETEDVTVYEERAEPGGHADSIEVHTGTGDGTGQRVVRVDLGAQHLPPTDAPTHTALRAQLGITGDEVVQAPMHMTVLAAQGPQPLLVSPHAPSDANGRTPVTGEAWQMLGQFLAAAVAFEFDDGDWETTLGEFTTSCGTPEPWATGYVHPWLASFVGCSAAEAAGMSARAAIAWVTRTAPPGPDSAPVFLGLARGMQHLATTLAGRLDRSVRTDTAASRIDVHGGGAAVTVHDRAGAVTEYDRVLLAVPAPTAARLLDGVRGVERQRTALESFRYVPATVTVHRDPAYMSEDRAHWSTNTTTIHGGWAETSTWYGPILGVDIFKSWTTHREPPRDAVAERSFRHLMVTPAAVRARAQLTALATATPVDFAGSYLYDVDSQESAVRTGAEAARRIAPHGERSAALLRYQRS